MLNFKSKAICCLLLWAFWYLNFILKPMCRSLKRSTYTAVKYLPSFAAIKAVNAESAEINAHLSYRIFDFFCI